jgi:Tol biopolymer transport system component
MRADAAAAGSGNAGRDIWIMNADGSSARQLTYGGGANAAWRP